jgi:hypothetical protein
MITQPEQQELDLEDYQELPEEWYGYRRSNLVADAMSNSRMVLGSIRVVSTLTTRN